MIVTFLKRKGQMEVFGLAVIVILLVVGMLFMIRWGILNPQQQAKSVSSYVNKDLTSNIVVYMLNVNVDKPDVCEKNVAVSDLVRDCALGSTITCFDETVPKTVQTCDLALSIVNDIFEQSLAKYGHLFYFSVYKSSNPEKKPIKFIEQTTGIEKEFKIGQKCSGTKVSGISFIPLPPDVLNLQLDVCT